MFFLNETKWMNMIISDLMFSGIWFSDKTIWAHGWKPAQHPGLIPGFFPGMLQGHSGQRPQ
jgi:hypothetical protein